MRYREFSETALEVPSLEAGDDIRIGKFRNQKAKIVDINDDDKRPKVKTTKGTKNLFTFDLADED